jgi:hypothetical protein
MNQHIKGILPFVSILILLVSACDARYLDATDATTVLGDELPARTQVQPQSASTPTPKGNTGDADQVLTLESIQTPIVPTGPTELVTGVASENIPSAEELDTILDTVNRGGPERPGSDEAVGEGPAPGTESHPGPVNDPSGVVPESKTLSVSELLENPIYDTEIRVYGQVSLLGEFSCPCFELISDGKKVLVSYGLMIEDDGTERPAVSVEGIQNGDQVVVTGELKTAGSHASVNDFWASKIEKAQ